MIGLTMVMPLSRNSRSFASWVAPRMFESVEYAFSTLILYSKPCAIRYSRHLLAAAQLVDELLVEPRLVDAQLRVGEQSVAVEPLDVVALEGAAVAPDVDAVFLHRDDQHRAGDGAAERRGVEVGGAAGGDVEGAALDGGDALGHELRPALDQPGLLGAVGHRLARDVVVVGLVGLAEVRGVGVGDRALRAHPVQRGAGVESARERDADLVADREVPEECCPMSLLEGTILRRLTLHS